MNEAKLWQLRAGLITESEYQEAVEEIGPGQNPVPMAAGSSADGEVDKPATSVSQLGKKFMDTSKDIRSQGSVINGGEAAILDKTMDQLIALAADPKNKTAILQRISGFIQKIKG